MLTPTWDELPEELRGRVDELLLADNRFGATAALWEASDRRWSLSHSQKLAHARHLYHGGRVRRRPEPLRDPATLIAKVEALSQRPDAIEAVWDGDTVGWMVLLYAVTLEPRAEYCLAMIRHGGDIRLFNGQVPPWPEAAEARETGAAVARHFGVPFSFEHPQEPELPDVRWWDTVRGVPAPGGPQRA